MCTYTVGQALVDAGETMKQLADIKDALVSTVYIVHYTAFLYTCKIIPFLLFFSLSLECGF